MRSICALPTIDEVDQKLDLTGRARSEANSGLPPTEQSELSATERAIQNHVISEVVGNCCAESQDTLARHHEERSKLQIHATISGIKGAPGDTEADLSALESREVALLGPLKVNELTAESDYKLFREVNGFGRQPKYPESKTFHWSIIFLVALIETILNGVFLSQGNEFGFVGGISYAVIITAINLIFAFLVGVYALPYCWHRDLTYKFFGWLSVIMWVCIASFFYFLFGHLRAAMGNLDEASGAFSLTPGRDAFKTFVENPFGISDVYGWMLVMISAAVGIFALIKFLTADDVYPGYGAIHRKLRLAQNTFADARASLADRELEVIRAWEKRVHNMRTDANRFVEEYKLSIHRSEDLVDAYAQYCVQAQSLYCDCIGRYRQRNMAVRAIPAPRYFDSTEEITINRFAKLDEYQLDIDKEELERVGEKINEVPVQYDIAIAKLGELKDKNADRIVSLRSTIEEKARKRVSNLDRT